MGRRVWITKKEAQKIAKLPPSRKAVFYYLMAAVFLVATIFFSISEYGLEIVSAIFGIITGGTFILAIIYTVIAINDSKAESARQQALLNSHISEVDNMNGVTFEEFLAVLFKNKGYQVQKTKASGDYGVDLILKTETESIIVQAKRYSKKVSVSAIQEIVAAKSYYNVYEAWVVTNNYFTGPAIALAKANSVKLIDRDKLADLIIQSKSFSHEMPLNAVNEITATRNDYPTETIRVMDNHFTPTQTTNQTESTTNETNSYITTIPKENYDLWYVNQLRAIKNKILEIYPSFDLNSIKKQINIAESYEIKSKQNLISLYYFYSEIIGIIYALRYKYLEAVDYCLELCDKSLNILQKTDLSNLSVPSLTKKAIILEKNNKIIEAIQVCDYATEHNYFDNGKPFAIRKERLLSKHKKQN